VKTINAQMERTSFTDPFTCGRTLALVRAITIRMSRGTSIANWKEKQYALCLLHVFSRQKFLSFLGENIERVRTLMSLFTWDVTNFPLQSLHSIYLRSSQSYDGLWIAFVMFHSRKTMQEISISETGTQTHSLVSWTSVWKLSGNFD